MKKKLIGLMIGAMGVMLVACATPSKTTEGIAPEAVETEVVEPDTQEEEIYESAFMENPWVDSDKEEVLEATGFNLVAPAEAANVAYSYMPSTGMAQMNYTTGDAMWVYRMQPADALEDISGIYCEWNYTEEFQIAGMEAMEYGYSSEPEGDFIDDLDYTRVVNWYDAQNKITYSLSVMGKNLDGMDTAVYAENLYNLK